VERVPHGAEGQRHDALDLKLVNATASGQGRRSGRIRRVHTGQPRHEDREHQRCAAGQVVSDADDAFPWQTPEANAVRSADVCAVFGQLGARFPRAKIGILSGNYGRHDTGQDKTPEPHDY
jgi:hypothetical protein